MLKVTSKKGTLQIRDFVQSLVASAIGLFASTAYELCFAVYNNAITTGNWDIDYANILRISIGAAVIQILRKLGQGENGKFLKK